MANNFQILVLNQISQAGLKRLPPRATLLTLERLDACVSLWRERHPPAIAV